MTAARVLVIGGGPAGLMASYRAGEIAAGVHLFEKNASIARKLGLTGKGRCNVTNVAEPAEFVRAFGREGVFLRSVLSRFSVEDLMNFFETRGVALKVERQGRVFPQADSSRLIVEALRAAAQQSRVSLRLSATVTQARVKVNGLFEVRVAPGESVEAERLIIACGGASYPETGSTGDGFRIAKDLGHTIERVGPGLVPLETEETFAHELQGLTLKNVRVDWIYGGKKHEGPVGEVLLTHFGVSGPLVLDASGEVAAALHKGQVKMMIDLKPGLTRECLDERMRREFGLSGGRTLKRVVSELLPQRLGDAILELMALPADKVAGQVTTLERRKLVDALKGLTLTISRPRPLNEAMVTHGGVSLKEIDPRTMESKRVPGLYFCGEVLDLAASSGGYNLQAAFSTGYVAGESAAKSLNLAVSAQPFPGSPRSCSAD